MTRPKKIILVVVDTLRADHLGCYGYKRNTSPFIDEFSKECLFFKYAVSPGSQTLPVLASVFTSKYIMRHSIWFNNAKKLDADREITLAEVLQSLGYETAGFVSTCVLQESTNIGKGFSVYDDEMTFTRKFPANKIDRDGKETAKRALDWAEKNKGNDFFLFIHFFDIHGPYVNPPQYKGMFTGDPYYGEVKMLDRVSVFSPVGGIPDNQPLNTVFSPNGEMISYEHDVRYYAAEYDGAIRYEDSVVGGFCEGLKAMGIYDEALIILMADHGESMGENNLYFEHTTTVTPEKVHVPLMIKPDAGRAMGRQEVDVPVSTIDIMPTILSLCGHDYGDYGFDGRPLAVPGMGRVLLSETFSQYAMTYPDGRIVVKYNPKHGTGRLADGRLGDGGTQKLLERLDNAAYALGPVGGSPVGGDVERQERIIMLEQKLVKSTNELYFLKETAEKATVKLEIEEAGRRIRDLEEKLAERDRRIGSMEKSFTWRSLQWLDGQFLKPLMPPGSRRGASYGRLLASLRGR